MSHDYHGGLTGIVLFDGCPECEVRPTKLWELDDHSLQELARIAERVYEDGLVFPANASHADRRAVYELRLMARIVLRSDISANASL